MITYHMVISWGRMRARAAATAIGLHGARLDATILHQSLRPKGGAGHFVLLRAFATQSIWSHSRLYALGYDVNPQCCHCGAPNDSPHHRLFECESTNSMRQDFLEDTCVQASTIHPNVDYFAADDSDHIDEIFEADEEERRRRRRKGGRGEGRPQEEKGKKRSSRPMRPGRRSTASSPLRTPRRWEPWRRLRVCSSCRT